MDGIIVYANPFFCKIMEVEKEDAEGSHVLDYVISQDRERTIAELQSDGRFEDDFSFTNTYESKSGRCYKMTWSKGLKGKGTLMYAQAEVEELPKGFCE